MSLCDLANQHPFATEMILTYGAMYLFLAVVEKIGIIFENFIRPLFR